MTDFRDWMWILESRFTRFSFRFSRVDWACVGDVFCGHPGSAAVCLCRSGCAAREYPGRLHWLGPGLAVLGSPQQIARMLLTGWSNERIDWLIEDLNSVFSCASFSFWWKMTGVIWFFVNLLTSSFPSHVVAAAVSPDLHQWEATVQRALEWHCAGVPEALWHPDWAWLPGFHHQHVQIPQPDLSHAVGQSALATNLATFATGTVNEHLDERFDCIEFVLRVWIV